MKGAGLFIESGNVAFSTEINEISFCETSSFFTLSHAWTSYLDFYVAMSSSCSI
jgi:hypothetical protein